MADIQVAIQIIGDASKAVKAFGDTGNAGGKLEGKLSGIGKGLAAMGGAFVGERIISGLRDMGQAAAEDQQEQARLANVLQNVIPGATAATVASVEDYILKTELASGVTDGTLRPAFQNLVAATKDVGEAQGIMGVAMDVAQAKGLDLETVTKALAKAHGGNTTALGKLGVAVKDASGKALSYDQILANLGATYGGAVATNAETLVGKQQRASVAFGELKETIGGAVIPVMEKVSEVISKLVGWFSNMSPAMQGTIGTIVAVVGAIAGVGMVVAPVIMALSALGPVLGIVGAAFGVLLGPIGLVILAVVAIGAAVFVLIKHWDDVKAAATTAVEWIKSAWQSVPGPIQAALAPLIAIISQPFKIAFEAVKAGIAIFKAVIHGDFGAIPGIIGGLLSNIGEIMTAPFRKGYELVKTVYGLLNSATHGKLGEVVSAVRSILAPVAAIIETPFKAGKVLVETAIKLIKAVVTGDFGAIPGIITGALSNIGEIIVAPFRAAYNKVSEWIGKIRTLMSKLNPLSHMSPAPAEEIAAGMGVLHGQMDIDLGRIERMVANRVAAIRYELATAGTPAEGASSGRGWGMAEGAMNGTWLIDPNGNYVAGPGATGAGPQWRTSRGGIFTGTSATTGTYEPDAPAALGSVGPAATPKAKATTNNNNFYVTGTNGLDLGKQIASILATV